MRLAAAAIVAALVAGGVYALHCWLFPFAACRRCHGDGKHRSTSGRSWRSCRRCAGTGRRVRIGRRVWVYLSTSRQEAP